MEAKKIFLFMVFLLAIFSLSKIRFLNDVMSPGQEVEMFASVSNNYDESADDVRVIAYMPELGEVFGANSFDVDDYDSYGKLMWWNLPASVPAGDYLVRVSASNDDNHVHKYRYITVE